MARRHVLREGWIFVITPGHFTGRNLMKRAIAPFFVAALAIGLAGCKEDAADTAAYEPTAEHCQPDYLKTLPDNKAREDLVEKCMTGGSYKKSEPKTW
jgi:entry exclusion lipoprotein TrbK